VYVNKLIKNVKYFLGMHQEFAIFAEIGFLRHASHNVACP
jgi:hypothetical protein